jgi:hypothetical protein
MNVEHLLTSQLKSDELFPVDELQYFVFFNVDNCLITQPKTEEFFLVVVGRCFVIIGLARYNCRIRNSKQNKVASLFVGE